MTESDSISKPLNAILSDKDWLGALYYKIILNKYKGDVFYTLLGLNSINKLSRKKIIDVLSFDKDYNPVFGKHVFKTIDSEPLRVIFEYSADASMSLKYEQQYYNKTKGKSIYAYDRINNFTNHKRNSTVKSSSRSRKVKDWMIVFDRLIPLNPGLEGQFQFYIPSVDYVDAFIFNNGMWRLIEDVDARNSK